MIELMAVYQGCKLAHEGIRNAVEIYQQFKEDGKDVSQIIGEITGHLCKFFQNKEELVTAEKEAKEQPKATINVNEEAMNRVMRTRELQRMETELREMIIYQIGLPGLWEEFDKMRQVVQKERMELERQKKKAIELARRKREILIEKYSVRAAICVSVLLWVLTFVLVEYSVYKNYQKSKYHIED